MKLRALIVDDEPPARKKLRHLLKNIREIEIVGEAGDGIQAFDMIDSLQPDLIFLDIQMPKMDGFELVRALGRKKPKIIFTTAFDQYAIRAFEVRALDYLLKPFDDNRLQEAIDRVLDDTDRDVAAKIESLLADLPRKQKYLRRILHKEDGKISIIEMKEVRWIQAEEKYVRLHTARGTFLHRETMNSLGSQLDPQQFARIHRSRIVNVQFIREVQPWSHGDLLVVLQDETQLPVGRLYRDAFLKTFKESEGNP